MSGEFLCGRSEYRSLQVADVLYPLRDASECFQRQVGAMRVGGRKGGGVNLNEGNLGTGFSQFAEAFRVLVNFPGRGFVMIESWEEALDDDRALAGDRQDVLHDSC